MDDGIIKNLSTNLSTGAKIAIGFFVQAIIIVIVISAVSILTKEPEKILVDTGNQQVNIPEKEWSSIKNRIWTILGNHMEQLNKNEIDDAVIREGTYNEEIKKNGNTNIHNASFLVDIDSLKQTFAVSVSWADSDKVEFTSNPISVECPKKSEMKYPETFCYGINTTTASPGIYLPYTKPKGEHGDYYYTIRQDYDDANKINVVIRACDYEKYKKEADKYLKSTGIKLDEYTIEYEENTTDRVCPD